MNICAGHEIYGRWFGTIRRHSKPAFLLMLCLGLAFAVLPPLYAQQLGGINGTITDQTGAVVPGAKIKAVSPDSGRTYTSQTSSAGTFLIVNVIPGSYDVTVSAKGFQTLVQKNFQVDGGSTAALMASLKVGEASVNVKVSGASTPLLTQSPDVGTTIQPEIWKNVPVEVSGGPRDPRTVALSNVPGVEFFNYGYGKIGGSQYGAEFNYFNGLPQNSNATMTPPYDFIDETHVNVTNANAEYGWGVGAVQFETKFGTNHLHGSLFEINRNSFFDSRGFHDPAPNPKPQNHQNNFGFSIGGPVIIPEVYDGRNKTFFYVSWEGFRQNNQSTGGPTTGYTTVPTAAMKQGDFSGLMTYNASGNVVQAPIYNPLSPDPKNPQQFTYNGQKNVIAPNFLSATSKSLLKYIPDPNTKGTGPGGLTDNYYYNLAVPDSYHRWAFSIDHQFSDNMSVNVAVTQSPTPQLAAYNGPPIFGGTSNPNPLSDLIRQNWPSGFIYGNYAWAIHPSLILTAGLSIPFDYSFTRTGLGRTLTIPAQNMAGAPAKGFPTIHFSGIAAPQGFGKGSGMVSVDQKTPYYAGYTNINWLHGKHQFNFGWQGMYYMNYGFSCESCAGTFNFLGSTTDNWSGSSLNPYGGSPFASFMIGQVDNASVSYSPETSLKYAAYAFYIQDAYKARPNLTLNGGLRWNIQIPQWTNNGEEDFVTPQSLQQPNSAAGGELGVLTRYGHCALCSGFNRANIHWGEVGPRLGFSYAVNHKTILSGGFSILWQQANSPNNSSGWNNDGYAFGVSNTINGTGTNTPGFGNWDTNTLNFPPPAKFSDTALTGQAVGYFDPAVSGRDPYYEMWNFGLQRLLPDNWFIRMTYLGQRGIHLVLSPVNMNQLAEGTPQRYGSLLSQGITSQAALNAGITAPFPNFSSLLGSSATVGQALKPYPQYTAINNNFNSRGYASYNSFQVEVDKRYSGGLALLSGLTLQKTLSNASGVLGWAGGMTNHPVDPWNPQTAIAPVGPDWMVNIAGTYDLPVGPGKRWFNNHGLTGELIGGWKVAWTQYYGSGSPHEVTAYGSPFGYGNLASRVQGIPIVTHGYGSVKHWIESGAPTGLKSLPTVIENNGAFVDPAVEAGYTKNSPQYEWIPGNSKAGYTQFRDPPYAVENVGLMKEFGLWKDARAIFRVDYFNVFNRWYIGDAVDMNIDSPTFGKVTTPYAGSSGQRQGQASIRIEF